MTEENKSVKKFPNRLPKLRFTGFEGSWTSIKIENIAPLQRGFDLPSQNIVNGNIPIVYSNGILKFHNESKCTAPGLVTGRSGTIGKFTFLEEGAYWPHNTSLWVTNFFDNDPKFIYYLYHTINIENFSTGSGVPTLNRNYVHNQICNIPPVNEQKKISSFLTSIDNRISTQKKIISQLKSQMSNLKDLIFEQQLRFSDDEENEFPNWQESKLENICEKQSSSISANKIEDNIGNYPIYGATGILKNIDFYEVENDYISIIKDGAGVGRLFYCKGKSSVLGTLDIIKPKNVNLFFLYLLLSRIDFKKYITGSTIPHIYFKDYKKEKVQIPSLKEQEIIANFFKSLDDKINIENSLLTQYENQKKYLLQNLFI